MRLSMIQRQQGRYYNYWYSCCCFHHQRSAVHIAAELSSFCTTRIQATRTRRNNMMYSTTTTTTNESSETTTTILPDAAINVQPIHILGAGSMGLLLAASIRAVFPSYPIGVLLRPSSPYTSQMKNGKGILQVCLEQQNERKGRKRMMRIIPVPSQIIHQEQFNNSSQSMMIRNLIVTTKAFQAVHAIKSIRHRLIFQNDTMNMHHHDKSNNNNNNNTTRTSSSRIIILCNGAMAIRDELLSTIPELQSSDIHLVITTHGAYRPTEPTQQVSQQNDHDNDNNMVHVIHAGFGHIDIPKSLQDLQPLLHHANLNVNVQTNSNMQRQLWCKLATNCIINPLTAIHQCTNGQLLNIPHAEEMLMDIIKEVATVARAVQCGRGNHDNNNNDNDDWIVDNDNDLETLLETYCHQVIHDTQNNKSSMLQDVLAHRKTEIMYLNGHVVDMGQRYGMNCPVNANLCRQIQNLTINFT